MTVREVYQFAIQRGMELDPRGKEALQANLASLRERHAALSEEDKLLFDAERLNNPFGDTRIVCGDETTEVRRMVVGIDIRGSDVLLAEALGRSGRPVDLVMSHHTSGLGNAMASAEDTMNVQVHMMMEAGVPSHVAEKIVQSDYELHPPGEDYATVQAAEALGVPLAAVHTPCDLHNHHVVGDFLQKARPARARDIVGFLKDLPECRWLMERGVAPRCLTGSPDDSVGRAYTCLIGGWNPTPAAFKAIAEAGIGTVIAVACTDELKRIAEEHRITFILYPHYPADSVGINLFLDSLMQEAGPIDIVPCSNFIRVER